MNRMIDGMNLQPEEQFIIKCLRSEFGKVSNYRLANFDLSNIDWNMVYEKSRQLGVTPLLSGIIKKRSSLPQFSNIPENFKQKIKITYLRTFLFNETRFKNILEVLEAFKKAGIKVVLLKGSHLAHYIYKDIGLRPMNDIDIMVKKNDLDKAVKLLSQMGYVYMQNSLNPQEQPIPTRPDRRSITPPTELHHLTHPKKRLNLDVHWAIESPAGLFKIDIERKVDGLWKRARKEKMYGTDVLVLSPEDLLLHLSLHASYQNKFRDQGLLPFCDIATTINQYNHEIDWNKLQLRAHEWFADKCLYLTLHLCQEILELSLPDSISSALEPQILNRKIVLEAHENILRHRNMENDVAIFYSQKFHPETNVLQKISFILKKLFIPPKDLAIRYSLPDSSQRVYFYYPSHIISLLRLEAPLYAKFFLYLFTHKKVDFYNYNLHTWLIPEDSENNFH